MSCCFSVSKNRQQKGLRTNSGRGGKVGRRVIEACASKWEMKTQRGTTRVGVGLEREDWQKLSSSTVGCLNLHDCCYTPFGPHSSPLMISNTTQSSVMALEANKHRSLWPTSHSFKCLETRIIGRNGTQSQLGLVRVEGPSFWLPDTLAAKHFVCHNTVEEDLPASLFTGSHDVLWVNMKDWMVAPAVTDTQLIMSAFVPTCQGFIKKYPNIPRGPLHTTHTTHTKEGIGMFILTTSSVWQTCTEKGM